MVVELDINDKIYEVRKMHELTYDDYLLLIELIEMDIPEPDKIKGILKYLTDVPDVRLMTDESLLQIDFKYILEPPQFELLEKINYHKMIDFDNMSFQRYIDLDTVDENAKIFALCYLPEEFNNKQLETLLAKFKELPMKNTIAAVSSYSSWKENILKQYDGLFTKQDVIPEDYDGDAPKYNNLDNWRSITMSLTNDDILREDLVLELNIFKVLNWLTLRHNKYEEEKSKQK